MAESKKLLEVQTKAVLIHAGGVGYVIKTGDGQAVAITSELAVDLANQILSMESGNALAVPPQRSSFLQ